MRSEVVTVMQIYTVAFHVMTMCNLGDGYKNLEEHNAAMYWVPDPSYAGSETTVPTYQTSRCITHNNTICIMDHQFYILSFFF